MDAGQHVPGFVETALNNLVMGFWAFCGAVMRGQKDWRDPETLQFSWWRMVVSLVTAFVLGEIAIGLSAQFHVVQPIIGGLSAVIGYVGPAPVVGFIVGLLKRFSGG
jgi:hypothetical protein